MSREELQRRLLIASDWAGVWSDSLDDIPENGASLVAEAMARACPMMSRPS